jgi:hypothetical protein
MTTGSVTAPMTEPTPRTCTPMEAAIAETVEWAQKIEDENSMLRRSLARKEVLMRDIEAAMRSPGTNMVGLQTLLKRIERELKG